MYEGKHDFDALGQPPCRRITLNRSSVLQVLTVAAAAERTAVRLKPEQD